MSAPESAFLQTCSQMDAEAGLVTKIFLLGYFFIQSDGVLSRAALEIFGRGTHQNEIVSVF